MNLDHCKTCHQPLPDTIKQQAHHQLEEKCCSPECHTKDYHKRHACCNQATPTNCVCLASYTCPTHGDTHIGTHD